MKRSTVISLGAAGLIAGTAYWSQPRRPAFCNTANRTPEQDQECRDYQRSTRLRHYYPSRHYYGSSFLHSFSSGSSASHSSSRGGFGSIGHSFHVSS